MKKEFFNGLRDGVPIALGYLSVSFSVGILAIASGLTVFQGALMSLTNVTSAGQFAGIQVIAAGGALAELALTQVIINLRYALMSLSLSQNLSEDVTIRQRLAISYMMGLESLPVLGWTAGTVLGAVAGEVLPASVSGALSIALYAMFLAIVLPVARRQRSVLLVVVLAAVFRCALYYLPMFAGISAGMAIIFCTVAAAFLGAWLFPVTGEEKEM